MKVFIVDDCAITITLIANMLVNNNIITDYSDTVDTNLYNRILNFKPDVILMDIYLNEYNGVLIANEIHKIPLLADVPIIAISGSDDLLNKVLINSDDFYTYIQKPITEQVLIPTIIQYASLGKLMNIKQEFLKKVN